MADLSYEAFLASQKKKPTSSLLYVDDAPAPDFTAYKTAPIAVPAAKTSPASSSGPDLSYEAFLASQKPASGSILRTGSTAPIDFGAITFTNQTPIPPNQSTPQGARYVPPPSITQDRGPTALGKSQITTTAIDLAVKAFDALDIISGSVALAPNRLYEALTAQPFGSTAPLRFSEAARGATKSVPFASAPIGFTAGIIGDPLNLITGGAKGVAKAVEQVVKVTDYAAAVKLGRSLGFTEDIAKSAGAVFIKADDATKARAALEYYANLQKTTTPVPVAKKAPTAPQKLTPDSARTAVSLFHPEDTQFAERIIEIVREGNIPPDEEWQILRGMFRAYGVTLSGSNKKIADTIADAFATAKAAPANPARIAAAPTKPTIKPSFLQVLRDNAATQTVSPPGPSASQALARESTPRLSSTRSLDVPSGQGTKLSEARKLLTSGERILKESGPAGEEMATLMKTQLKEEDLLAGYYNVTIKEALEGFTKDERLTLTAALEGQIPVRELDARYTKAYAKLRSLLDEIAYRAEGTGVQVRVGQGGPLVPFKRRENYFPRQYDIDGLTKGKRRDKALQHLVDTGQARNLAEAEKALDDFIMKNAERRSGNLENARLLDLPDYERDPLISLPLYTRSVAKRFTELDHYGPKDQVIADLIARITAQGGDYKEAQRIFDLTVEGSPKNALVSAITQFNTATKLSLSFITNMTQIVNTMSKAGVKATARALWRDIMKHKDSTRLAELVNAYDDFLIVNEAGFEPGRIVRGVLYLFRKVEDFNRRTAANTGKFRAEELLETLKKQPDAAYALRQMESLGIDPKSALQNGLTERQLIEAAHAMIQKTQFKVNPLTLPPSWRTPLGRILTQFRSFTFMQTKFVRDEIIAESKKGNFVPAITFILTAVPASYLATEIRNKLTGREEGNIDIREWDRWMRAFGTIPSDLLIQGKFLYDTFKSDLKTPIEKGARLAGTFLGPTADETGKFIGGLERIRHQQEQNKYLRVKGKEVDPYLGLKRQAVEKIPFVGQWLKNRFFSYPPSTTTPERKEANKALYGNIKKWGKEPYGDPAVHDEVLEYIQSLPDDEERQRQLFVIRENGIETTRISSSKAINDMRPTYDRIQQLIEEGKEDTAKGVINAMSDDEYDTYKKIRAAERAKNTAQMRELLAADDPEVVRYLRSLSAAEGKRLVGLMTDEEYAAYERLKGAI